MQRKNRNDVESLLKKFCSGEVLKTAAATYSMRVPSVGPEAFLNIIFNPLPEATVARLGRELRCPDALMQFFRRYNGLRLFFDELSVFGMRERGALLDRSSPVEVPTLSLRDTLNELRHYPTWNDDIYPVGWYAYDGSYALMRRPDDSVYCSVGSDLSAVRVEWTDFDSWLTSEISRIADLYDEKGIRLVSAAHTVPSRPTVI